MTVEGFGFGRDVPEKCALSHGSWDAILVTVVAFGTLSWKRCAQSHRFGLGRVGGWGGIPLGGGGSANRTPGSYIYIYVRMYIYTHIDNSYFATSYAVFLNPMPRLHRLSQLSLSKLNHGMAIYI